MAQELGRIQRPALERFAGKRKLLLVPLLFQVPDLPEEGQTILDRYWAQVQQQVTSLQGSLGTARHLFHEGVTTGGAEGLKLLNSARDQSYAFTKGISGDGETLEATESGELLAEVLDLQRCLSIPFASDKVPGQLQSWFGESSRARYDHIASRIDETVQEDEVAVLLIGERHQVQFPGDIEVIYVSPPALEEFHRWLRDWLSDLQRGAGEHPEPEPEQTEDSPPPSE